MIDAKRRGMAVSGAVRARAWSPCHLGRNPRNGGSLASDRSIVDVASLAGGDKVDSEVIFCEDKFMKINESMIIVVVIR